METITIETAVAHEAFHDCADGMWTNERDDHIGPGESARGRALGALIAATDGLGVAYPFSVEVPDDLALVARDVVENMEANETDLLPGSVRIGEREESIFDYFARKLGQAPQDATLRELPVASGCGVDCKAAIDGAAALMRASTNAIGSTRAPAICEIAEETVRVFWHG